MDYTITQLCKAVSHRGPYLNRALTPGYSTKYKDSNEAALLAMRWTISLDLAATLLYPLMMVLKLATHRYWLSSDSSLIPLSPQVPLRSALA